LLTALSLGCSDAETGSTATASDGGDARSEASGSNGGKGGASSDSAAGEDAGAGTGGSADAGAGGSCKSDGPGDSGVVAYRFQTDFSGTQGKAQWFYRQWDGASYSDMAWDAANGRWQGNCEFCIIDRNWVHPDQNDAVIAWQAPRAGSLVVSGTLDSQTLDPTADGVRMVIKKQSKSGLSQL